METDAEEKTNKEAKEETGEAGKEEEEKGEGKKAGEEEEKDKEEKLTEVMQWKLLAIRLNTNYSFFAGYSLFCYWTARLVNKKYKLVLVNLYIKLRRSRDCLRATSRGNNMQLE